MPQKVVIIGHSYSSRLGIIRSVAQIGCEIIVVVMSGHDQGELLYKTKPIDCYSKYVSKVLYCARRDESAFIRLLLDKCADSQQKVILIPDSDDSVAIIDENKEILKKYFLFPHILGDIDSVHYWMNKSNQKELASSLGLNVANGKIIDIVDGRYVIPKDVLYPCYTKPLATMNGGKGGMRRCDNVQELSESLDYIIRHRCRTIKVLLEDYKEIEQEYALLGFSDGKEVIIPGILKILALSQQNKGISRQGIVMPVGDLAQLMDLFQQLIIKIGFIGVFDIDFYRSEGVYYFCEINFRFGGSGYAYTKMGVNLPAMLVKHLMGDDFLDMNKSIEKTATYANERMCLADWSNQYISLKEYRSILESVDIRFVKDELDPLPEKKYEQEFRKTLIRKWLKKVYGKIK